MNLPFSNKVLYPSTVEHKTGNVYKIWFESKPHYITYVLLACTDTHKRQLISLGHFGNRWADAIEVKTDLSTPITNDLFENMVNVHTYVSRKWQYVGNIADLMEKVGLA